MYVWKSISDFTKYILQRAEGDRGTARASKGVREKRYWEGSAAAHEAIAAILDPQNSSFDLGGIHGVPVLIQMSKHRWAVGIQRSTARANLGIFSDRELEAGANTMIPVTEVKILTKPMSYSTAMKFYCYKQQGKELTTELDAFILPEAIFHE